MNEQNSSRNMCLVQDYVSGKNLPELSRSYGLTERRIRQILDIHQVQLRERSFDREPISKLHERIGRMLVDFRFEKDLNRREVAEQLQWSVYKIRKIEEGRDDLALLDLLDLGSYIGKNITEVTTFVADS